MSSRAKLAASSTPTDLTVALRLDELDSDILFSLCEMTCFYAHEQGTDVMFKHDTVRVTGCLLMVNRKMSGFMKEPFAKKMRQIREMFFKRAADIACKKLLQKPQRSVPHQHKLQLGAFVLTLHVMETDQDEDRGLIVKASVDSQVGGHTNVLPPSRTQLALPKAGKILKWTVDNHTKLFEIISSEFAELFCDLGDHESPLFRQ